MKPGTPIKCTNCGAMLTQVEGATPIAECAYCHAQVFVGAPSPAVVIQQVREQAARQSRKGLIVGIGVAVAIVGLLVVRGLVGGGGSTKTATPEVASVPAPVPERPAPPPPKPAPAPSIGKVVLAFGEAGTNAGQLTNARAFTVMPSGEIVIAEVDTGRVQVFDAKGVYQRMITIPPGALTKSVSMYGVGSDDQGHAIVCRDGDLVVLDVAAGKVAKVIRGSYPDRYYSSDVHVTPDGTIWAVTDDRGDYAIGKVSLDGKVRGRIAKTNTRRFAVDGLGTVFLAKTFEKVIEVRDAKGEIQSKFSQTNPARGKFGHLDEIAVDGKGHVFVQEGRLVSIFDAAGAFLGEVEVGSVADLAVDRQGFLYVLDRAKVTKYELTLPR